MNGWSPKALKFCSLCSQYLISWKFAKLYLYASLSSLLRLVCKTSTLLNSTQWISVNRKHYHVNSHNFTCIVAIIENWFQNWKLMQFGVVLVVRGTTGDVFWSRNSELLVLRFGKVWIQRAVRIVMAHLNNFKFRQRFKFNSSIFYFSSLI